MSASFLPKYKMLNPGEPTFQKIQFPICWLVWPSKIHR